MPPEVAVGLRSGSLFALLALVTAGLAAAALGWPALARRGPAGVLARICVLGVLQACVLALIFAWVNRSQEFYSSWSDLLGTDTVSGQIVPVTGGGPAGSPGETAPVALLPTAPGRHAARLRPGGLQQFRFTGAVSGISADGYVFLPPGYSATGPRLPVLVVISSRLRGRTAGSAARQVAATAAAAIAARHLPKLVIVMLRPDVGGHHDEGCLDVPGGPQAATFFTQDVPRAVGEAFRVSMTPSRWGVIGGPGGGYCALQLATSPAAPFAVAAVPSGSYATPPGTAPALTTWLRAQDSVTWRLQHWPPPPLQVRFTTAGGGSGLATLARPPLRVTLASPIAGTVPLAQILVWAGRALTA
jgi:enterochelin esterase-like enzyme